MFNCSITNSVKIINLFILRFPHLLNEHNTDPDKLARGYVNCNSLHVT